MATQYRQMITKTLIGAAVVASCCVGLAAPAGAEPGPDGELHPFDALDCAACEATTWHGGLAPGIHEGLRQFLGD